MIAARFWSRWEQLLGFCDKVIGKIGTYGRGSGEHCPLENIAYLNIIKKQFCLGLNSLLNLRPLQHQKEAQWREEFSYTSSIFL